MRESEIEYRDRWILIGLNIKYYRTKANLTQEELAEKAKLSRGVIGHLEAPDMYHSSNMKTLFKIADALGISTYKLIMFRDVE